MDDSKYTQTGALTPAHRQRIGTATRYPGRVMIEGNICNYNGGSGIQIHASSNATVKNNTCVGNRLLAFLPDWQYLNQGQVALTHSQGNHVLNNVLVSDAVVHAFGYGGAPYAASEYDGGNNFWEANLLFTKVAGSILTDNPVTRNKAIIGNLALPMKRPTIIARYRSRSRRVLDRPCLLRHLWYCCTFWRAQRLGSHPKPVDAEANLTEP